MAGTQETSIRSYNYYIDTTIAGLGTYAENAFEFIDVDDGTPFLSHSIVWSNDDAANDLFFRFTPDPGGGAPHGRVRFGETLQLDFKRARRIYFSGTPGLPFRCWIW